jgi:hypothetical protein
VNPKEPGHPARHRPTVSSARAGCSGVGMHGHGHHAAGAGVFGAARGAWGTSEAQRQSLTARPACRGAHRPGGSALGPWREGGSPPAVMGARRSGGCPMASRRGPEQTTSGSGQAPASAQANRALRRAATEHAADRRRQSAAAAQADAAGRGQRPEAVSGMGHRRVRGGDLRPADDGAPGRPQAAARRHPPRSPVLAPEQYRPGERLDPWSAPPAVGEGTRLQRPRPAEGYRDTGAWGAMKTVGPP